MRSQKPEIRRRIFEGSAMTKMKRSAWSFGVVVGMVFASGVLAQTPVRFDSETISGLGARNIGSAAMSARIAALAAGQEGRRLTIYVCPASGGVWKSQSGGSTYYPVLGKQPGPAIRRLRIEPQAPKP